MNKFLSKAADSVLDFGWEFFKFYNIIQLFKIIAISKLGMARADGLKWKGVNRKQSTRWQHLSRLKASAFFSLQKNFSCYETQQLILGTGTAIWWVTEPTFSVYRQIGAYSIAVTIFGKLGCPKKKKSIAALGVKKFNTLEQNIF
jgi:hypothetical protein